MILREDDEIQTAYRRARAAFLEGDLTKATVWYNFIRHRGLDLYYEVELPEHLMLVHPVGTVLGRATYGDYLVCYQNVGVGSDLDGNRPVIGEGVVLFPGAKVLGKTKIGNNVLITANTVVQGVEIPDNSVVFPGVVAVGEGDTAGVVVAFNQRVSWKPTRRNNVRQHFFGENGLGKQP